MGGISTLVISRLKEYPDDIKTVAHWYYQEWDCRNTRATVLDTIDQITKFDERIGFVAHINGKPVGAAEISFVKSSSCPDYKNWIDGIYVLKPYRGIGVSDALIKYAILEAKASNLVVLHLRCEEHLIRLYEKYGFKVIFQDGCKFVMELEI